MDAKITARDFYTINKSTGNPIFPAWTVEFIERENLNYRGPNPLAFPGAEEPEEEKVEIDYEGLETRLRAFIARSPRNLQGSRALRYNPGA